MPHVHRPTISDAYASGRVSAIVAVVADPDTHTIEATTLEVPSGTVTEIVAWIDGDPSRARAAVGHRLKGVRDAVAALIEDAG